MDAGSSAESGSGDGVDVLHVQYIAPGCRRPAVITTVHDVTFRPDTARMTKKRPSKSKSQRRQHEENMASPAPRRDAWDVLVVLGLAVVICGALWLPNLRRVYPFTYDETWYYMPNTEHLSEWLSAGLAHARAGEPLWMFSREAVDEARRFLDLHPGFVKLVGIIPARLVSAVLGRDDGARLTGGLFLALAAGTLYWFFRPRIGRAYSVIAAAGLASLPRVFGHGHYHALDVPIMAMYLLSALAFYRAAHLDRWGPSIASGALAGLAMATKLNAVALAPHLGIWLLIARPRGWKKALVGLVVGVPVFFALWPWLWHDTLARLARYLHFHSHHFYIGASYLGETYGGATNAPISYPVVMLALTMPVTWLLVTAGGLVMVCFGRRSPAGSFFALGLLANLGLMMLPSGARYGGIRLFLPAVPFAIGLGILAAHWLTTSLSGRGRAGHPLVVAALATLLLAPGVVGCVRYHPYCISYYSEVLGLSGAQRLGMDVTYWGDAYAGAREFLNRPENADARFYTDLEIATGVIDALIDVGEVPPQHRMEGRFVKTQLPSDADWILVGNYPSMRVRPVGNLVRTELPHETITCRGVPLAWVFKGPGHESHSSARDSDGDARD